MHYMNVAVLDAVNGSPDESGAWRDACPGFSLPSTTLTRDATPRSVPATWPGNTSDYACYWPVLLRVAKLLRVLKSTLYM
jgi:hypothetical protein